MSYEDSFSSRARNRTVLLARPPSPRRTTRRTRTPTSSLFLGPSLDLSPQPELHTPLAEVEHGPRHIAVALLVLEHGVAMGETERLSDALRIQQVVGVDPDHRR